MSEQDQSSGDQAQDATTDNTDSTQQDGTDQLPEWARKQLEKARGDAAKYRTRARELEPLAAKAKEAEDREKSETDRLTERAAAAEARAAEVEARAVRLEVAFEKGLTPAQAKRLVGGTREELEADADEVLRDFPVKPVKASGDIAQGTRPAATPNTPQEKISAGLAEHMR